MTFDREPDYVILSGGGSIADLSDHPELQECADCVIAKVLEQLERKVKGE